MTTQKVIDALKRRNADKATLEERHRQELVAFDAETRRLKSLCDHTYTDGTSAIKDAYSFDVCEICHLDNY